MHYVQSSYTTDGFGDLMSFRNIKTEELLSALIAVSIIIMILFYSAEQYS